MPKTTITHAISIQQPFAEQILTGTKKAEFRSHPTKIRGRVLVYASLKPGPPERWRGLRWQPGELPAGVLVGSVDIVDCGWDSRRGCYAYRLRAPKRLRTPIVPANRSVAGPVFWKPKFPGSPNGATYRRPT